MSGGHQCAFCARTGRAMVRSAIRLVFVCDDCVRVINAVFARQAEIDGIKYIPADAEPNAAEATAV